jgi:uncharacterized protein YceH (UPF0502 family)
MTVSVSNDMNEHHTCNDMNEHHTSRHNIAAPMPMYPNYQRGSYYADLLSSQEVHSAYSDCSQENIILKQENLQLKDENEQLKAEVSALERRLTDKSKEPGTTLPSGQIGK